MFQEKCKNYGDISVKMEIWQHLHAACDFPD